jgi:hypothetical protein
MIGGHYSIGYQPCEWQITTEGDKHVLRFYCDFRYEGKSFVFNDRFEALEAAEELICAEVA